MTYPRGKYLRCPVCWARPGQPCINTSTVALKFMKTVHKSRQRLIDAGAVTVDEWLAEHGEDRDAGS